MKDKQSLNACNPKQLKECNDQLPTLGAYEKMCVQLVSVPAWQHETKTQLSILTGSHWVTDSELNSPLTNTSFHHLITGALA